MLYENTRRVIKDVATLPAVGQSNSIYHNTTDGFFYYWNDVTGTYVKLEPLNVLTTVQPTPTATGNTTNLNTTFKDAAGDTWIVDSNGDAIKAGAAIVDTKYSKMLFVDRINGNDSTGTGSDNNMYKTIAKALTVADGSGYRIVLGAGTYTESVTVNQQNLDIVTVAGATRGNTFINGTVTFTNPASSSGIHGISMNSLVVSGAGSVYVKDSQVNTSLSKTGSGYFQVEDSEVTAVSITGAGQSVFIGGKQSGLTVNNAAAVVSVKNSDNLLATTVTAGTLGLNDTTCFATTAAGKAIASAAGTNVIVNNTQCYGSTGLLTSVTLGGNYSFDDALLDKVNSTLGNNIGNVAWFDDVGLINVPTITTATKALVRDANGRVSEQTLPSGGVSFGSAAPSAAGIKGDVYYKTTDGTSNGSVLETYHYDGTSWVLVSRNEYTKITSLVPKVYQGSGYVNARANVISNVADAFLLSDGTYLNSGRIVIPAHGYTVGNWYYLSQTTAGAVTDTYPTSGIVQQLFFVEDASTLLVNIEQAVNPDTPTYANLVYVNNTNVNSGTIFDLNNPPTTNNNALKQDVGNLYVGTDGSTWIWNGTTYVTKTFSSTTEWYLQGSTIDAQGNKVSRIYREGNISVGVDKYYGGITAKGGTAFSVLPEFGVASIGRVSYSSGWTGAGFLFANQTSGTNAFSMVYNGDQAYFGYLKTGSIHQTQQIWGSTGVSIGSTDGLIAAPSNNPSALFALHSATQGFLPPRMTTTQINAIVNPANGLVVYNTTLNKLCVRENSAWKQVTTTAM
jgi:hypothetical protein